MVKCILMPQGLKEVIRIGVVPKGEFNTKVHLAVDTHDMQVNIMMTQGTDADGTSSAMNGRHDSRASLG